MSPERMRENHIHTTRFSSHISLYAVAMAAVEKKTVELSIFVHKSSYTYTHSHSYMTQTILTIALEQTNNSKVEAKNGLYHSSKSKKNKKDRFHKCNEYLGCNVRVEKFFLRTILHMQSVLML